MAHHAWSVAYHRRNASHWRLLALALLVGLAVRVALWGHLPRQGMISDEAEYLAAATWLAQGRGFSWHEGWLWTRAPLYPLFLAAHVRLFGMNPVPIYLSQTLLSLLNVVLVYVLALQMSGKQNSAAMGEKVVSSPPPGTGGTARPFLAALLTAVLFPFATYPQILLSETFYLSLILGAWVILAYWQWLAAPRLLTSSLLLGPAGVVLGLATLTRGLTAGFLPLVALWVWWIVRRSSPALRLLPVLVFVLAGAGTILPWSWYASHRYGGPVLVDTTGAFNLLLGARTAYDQGRSDAPTRAFLLALLDEHLQPAERRALLADSCLFQEYDRRLLAALEQPVSSITQGQRQQLMSAEGLCLLARTPLAFVQKSLGEMVDFFQINYTGSERMTDGFTSGRLPRWYLLALFLLDDTLYVIALPLAVVGWFRTRGSDFKTLTGLWVGYFMLTTPLLFAINRFRLPLMPFVFLYAAAALANEWQEHASAPFAGRRMRWLLAGLVSLVVLVTTTPYAYLQPEPSSWASYLGPYPSSLAITRLAWEKRPLWLHDQQVTEALGQGDAAQARALLADGGVSERTRSLAMPLVRGLEGHAQEGLALLPNPATIADTKDWQAAVVRGDLLRRLGDEDGARAALTPTFVDDQNPVEWAWQWLHPPPTRRIDLAGNLDLGYIQGFYLGEGDPEAGGTFRWSGPEARLRFPQQGSGAPQWLGLRADGRGWPDDMPRPRVSVLVGDGTGTSPPIPAAVLVIQDDIQMHWAELPPVPLGADLVVTLRSEVFVPGAADLLAQQGPQAGQLRTPGVRLDWAELREHAP
ncbi:MAG: hypothetical protein HC884_01265 [Chloroflexaceae bacterium]|nr:hypothetical protein [Chloroflexaceae bacterium]